VDTLKKKVGQRKNRRERKEEGVGGKKWEGG